MGDINAVSVSQLFQTCTVSFHLCSTFMPRSKILCEHSNNMLLFDVSPLERNYGYRPSSLVRGERTGPNNICEIIYATPQTECT